MEERMIQNLQDTLNNIREARQMEDKESEQAWQEHLRHTRAFFEEVTGKHVYIHNWVVEIA